MLDNKLNSYVISIFFFCPENNLNIIILIKYGKSIENLWRNFMNSHLSFLYFYKININKSSYWVYIFITMIRYIKFIIKITIEIYQNWLLTEEKRSDKFRAPSNTSGPSVDMIDPI